MRKLLRKLEGNWKLQILIFTTLMLSFTVMYLVISDWIHKQYEIIKDDYSWVYQVDEIENEDGKLKLSGWAFKLKEDAPLGNCEILLHDVSTGETFYPKMSYTEREDVNQYFLCEYDYTNSGFVGTISATKLDLENRVYEIFLRPGDNRKVYATGIYYANGEMMFVNPAEYKPLDVTGTDLEQIVNNGVLRVYRPDYGTCVYQYKGELYWIAESRDEIVNEDTYVQYQLYTTQIDKLPEERLANNWLFSNIGFMFRRNELLDWNTGKYRVTKSALPTEYSITKIWTGNYIKDKSVWAETFRPWYEFD